MATQRKISDGVWSNPWMQPQAPHAKLIWAFLLANPATENSGIYQITIKTIYDALCGEEEKSNDTLTKAEVNEIIQRWVDDGHVLYEDGYVGIRDFHQHNSYLANSKYITNITHQLRALPKKIADRFIKFVIPATEIGNPLAIDRQSIGNPLNTNTNTNTKINTKSKVNTKSSDTTTTPVSIEIANPKTVHLINSSAVRDDGRSEWAKGVWLSDKEWDALCEDYGDTEVWEGLGIAEKQYITDNKPKNAPYVRAILKRRKEESDGKSRKRA